MLLCGCGAAASAAATALAEANEKELALRAQLAELQQAASSMSDRAVMDATYAKAAKIDDVEEQLVAALDDLSEAKQELGEVKSELGEVRQENARLGTTMDAMGAKEAAPVPFTPEPKAKKEKRKRADKERR